MRVLTGIYPENVFRVFEEICAIPHGSGSERELSNYLMRFAASRGLYAVQDEALNVIITKPGTPSYENSQPVVIQAHMDMVCEKNEGTEHDFIVSPIRLIVEGDYIKARGTTLGADNGIAVAYALALLDEKDIPHPPLEVLLTTGEEIGMLGAKRLDPALIKGRRLINIDDETEGDFIVSCAGGIKTDLILSGQRCTLPAGFTGVKISVTGLKGGHSGMEIDKERANANRLLGRMLNTLTGSFDIYTAHICGGLKDNAIPREAWAVVAIPENKVSDAAAAVKDMGAAFKQEFRESDPQISLAVSQSSYDGLYFDKQTLNNAITVLLTIPNGIQAFDQSIPGLVETSNNLGVVRTEADEIIFTSAVRSSVASRKYLLKEQIEALARSLNGRTSSKNDYSAWAYNPYSKLRDVFTEAYTAKYGRNPRVTGIHAGLECGTFAEKFPDMDMIAFGPDIHGAHTPDERASISSAARMWEFLLVVLSKLK